MSIFNYLDDFDRFASSKWFISIIGILACSSIFSTAYLVGKKDVERENQLRTYETIIETLKEISQNNGVYTDVLSRRLENMARYISVQPKNTNP